jgi:hypothetical protein
VSRPRSSLVAVLAAAIFVGAYAIAHATDRDSSGHKPAALAQLRGARLSSSLSPSLARGGALPALRRGVRRHPAAVAPAPAAAPAPARPPARRRRVARAPVVRPAPRPRRPAPEQGVPFDNER